jgi:group I intron endonuclease
MGFIYLIKNTISSKCYVGQTIQKNVKNRWRAHKNMHGTILASAFAKHGIENFEFSVITEAPNEKLDEMEMFEIETRNTITPYGYNIESGGNSRKIVHVSSKMKMRVAKLGENNHNFGKPRSEETRQKIGLAHIGKTHTEETKELISLKKKGTNMGENNPFFNRNHTPETKAKLGTAVDKYTKDGEFLETFSTVTFAAQSVSIDRRYVTACLIGRQKTAGGFSWKYSVKEMLSI